MSTPGSNLFRRAIRLIKPSQIQYLQAIGRTKNAARQWITEYAAAVTITASVQAVNRAKYQYMGLDFAKNYVKVFSNSNVVSLNRDAGVDRFIIAGVTYQVDDNNNWFLQDGWTSCLAIELPPGTP